ncbi:hypothetical protein [Prescottella agglutinans]|uniref:Secreted protein n=1 Tax=Prescottella agglutinans TaxID=1644129 RepID=A0ABT6M3P4_9NOCA|nr:hypothetical protein [Prescottella agglutinans]MDH6278923.1 hypothetical protein [Prescottella agglutinans]
MFPAVLLVCVPLFVALVGHSAYRVRQANKAYAQEVAGDSACADDSEPTATYREW